MKTIPLILMTNVLLVSGQLLWKYGLKKIGGFSLTSGFTLPKFGQMISSPYVLAGLALFAMATLVWFEILSRVDLSFAYPFQAIAYVLGVLAAIILFHEHVSLTRWLGVAVICLGIFLISRT